MGGKGEPAKSFDHVEIGPPGATEQRPVPGEMGVGPCLVTEEGEGEIHSQEVMLLPCAEVVAEDGSVEMKVGEDESSHSSRR